MLPSVDIDHVYDDHRGYLVHTWRLNMFYGNKSYLIPLCNAFMPWLLARVSLLMTALKQSISTVHKVTSPVPRSRKMGNCSWYAIVSNTVARRPFSTHQIWLLESELLFFFFFLSYSNWQGSLSRHSSYALSILVKELEVNQSISAQFCPRN